MKIKIAVIVLTMAISSTLVTNSSIAASKSRTVTINFVGDVHGESAIKTDSLASLKQYFSRGDLNIFNLETAVTNQDVKEEKEYNFKTNAAFLKSLKSVGLNLANIANNHSYDYGLIGFEDTLKNLDRAGMDYVGGGLNSSAAYKGRIYTIKGMRIGVLGIAKVNGGPESIATREKAGTTNGYDKTSTEQAITQLRAMSDLLIVVTHWGEEGSFCPRDSEMSSAKKWSALGADIILGSHTHTLQPVTLENNKLVAYSMGNFIFYSSKLENRRTGILRIQISPQKKISYSVLPMTINNLTKIPEKAPLSDVPGIGCAAQAKTTVR